ncbi:ABC transporter permease subunit [Rossellomorea sp. YZS02]|uniref:ABC transporter permease subunit n=1 Tax=Rossellomorea sp. YZS02 TaxID=3097358 RepID=UPI002A0CDFF1|nr:ABC transporter permease subunit [Rossellomorea sp. YZS02]MDX8346145.1 ABC transporter permease subunit [Rossellomorea sp. YZS02]
MSSLAAITCISCIPYLFNHITLDLSSYWQKILELLTSISSLQELEFSTGRNVFRPIFPTILPPLAESLILVGGSIILSMFISIIISFTIVNFNRKVISTFQEIFTYIQAVPDIFYILVLQILVVWTYQKTNIQFLNFASFGEEQAIFLPILSLSITPTMIITKLLISQILEELTKSYATLALAKGISFRRMILVHVFRNTVYSLFHYSKTIILFFLTNLLIVEYLFNIPGIMSFILQYPYPEVFFVGISLIYYPIFLLFQCYELFVPHVIKKGGS